MKLMLTVKFRLNMPIGRLELHLTNFSSDLDRRSWWLSRQCLHSQNSFWNKHPCLKITGPRYADMCSFATNLSMSIRSPILTNDSSHRAKDPETAERLPTTKYREIGKRARVPLSKLWYQKTRRLNVPTQVGVQMISVYRVCVIYYLLPSPCRAVTYKIVTLYTRTTKELRLVMRMGIYHIHSETSE